MRSRRDVRKVARGMRLLLLSGCLVGIAAAALAQNGAPSPITTLTTLDVPDLGAPPTGPYTVVIEHDPGLQTHTIYRPVELTMNRHPVLVWGEGGCAKNGLTFPKFLSEIASYGVVVVADGPPVMRPAGGPNAARAGGPAQGAGRAAAPGGQAAARGNAPRGGGRGAGGRAGGAPNGASMVNGTALVAAIDWLEAQVSNRNSRFYNKVDVQHVAAMGMSCGGLMSYGASNDRRVSTVGIWNSGLFPNEDDPGANAKIYEGMHGSAIIVTGGESDIAYENGKRDFELMPAKIPTFYGVHPAVGHGGTYNQDNGGPFGKAAVAWLKWQLMGDTSAAGRGYFVGNDCGLCRDSGWQVQSRSLR